MIEDVSIRVFDRKTGVSLCRASFQVIQKELIRGGRISLVADSDDGRRLTLQLAAQVIEDVSAPPDPAGSETRLALAEAAARIHSGL